MDKKLKIVDRCIKELFQNVISSPLAFQSELDFHTELYRILYNKLAKIMYPNKGYRKKDKILHSNYYSKHEERSFYDLSIYQKRSYDLFLELKKWQPLGSKEIINDIKKIVKDKPKAGFIINVDYRKPKFNTLYKDDKKMFNSNKRAFCDFKNKIKKKLSKNNKTELYYYFLRCDYHGHYLKLISQIKKSEAQIIDFVYKDRNMTKAKKINNLMCNM